MVQRVGTAERATRRQGAGRAAARGLGLALTAVLAGALPAGCSDRALDTGLVGSLTGQQTVLPDSPVRPMTNEAEPYPNLASVPPRPTDIPTVGERQQDLQSLERDRAASRAAARTLEQDLAPVQAPPRPTLTPGRPAQKNP